MGLLRLVPFLLFAACAGRTPAGSVARPVVMLDPGHTDADSGTWSCTGRREVEYNDRLTERVAERLRREGDIDVRLTRAPHVDIALRARAEAATRAGARLFLSLHHDAAQERFQKETREGERRFPVTTRPLRGYSLFVSQENPRAAESLRLARLIGEHITATGRRPTLHHAEKIAGEGRVLLDERLGIHEYTTLAVLRRTTMPAVLVEAGVITDRADEAYVTDPARERELVDALARAVRDFLGLP